jgi:hypothetical protein
MIAMIKFVMLTRMMLNGYSSGEWLRDGNGKHVEGLCAGFVPDLQCRARNADE